LRDASQRTPRAAGAIVIYYGIGNAFGPVLALFLAFVLVRRMLIPALPKRPSGYRLYPRTSASAFQMLRKGKGSRKPPEEL